MEVQKTEMNDRRDEGKEEEKIKKSWINLSRPPTSHLEIKITGGKKNKNQKGGNGEKKGGEEKEKQLFTFDKKKEIICLIFFILPNVH